MITYFLTNINYKFNLLINSGYHIGKHINQFCTENPNIPVLKLGYFLCRVIRMGFVLIATIIHLSNPLKRLLLAQMTTFHRNLVISFDISNRV